MSESHTDLLGSQDRVSAVNNVTRRTFLKRTGAASMAVVGASVLPWDVVVAVITSSPENSGYSLQFTMMGPGQVSNGPETRSTSASETTLNPALMVVAAEASGELILTIKGVSDSDKSKISWSAARNIGDSAGAKSTTDITITENANDKRIASVGPTNLKGCYGSFFITIKLESDKIFVGQLVIVRAEVNTAKATQHLSWIHHQINADFFGLYSKKSGTTPPPLVPFLEFEARITLRGGAEPTKSPGWIS